MKKQTSMQIVSWGIAMLMIGVLTGCQQEAPMPEKQAAIPVEILPVAQSSLSETTVITGVLKAYRAVDVISETTGKTQAIHHDIGDRVAADDLLAAIDKEVARENLAQVDAQLLAAKARNEMAFNDFRRDSTLFANSDISTATYDNSRLTHQASVADLNSTLAARALAKRQLKETDIRAPFAGLISRRYCELGAYIAPGQPMFRMVDIDSLRLELGVAQRNVAHLAVDQIVNITCDALPGHNFTGRLRSISPEADQLTRTFGVEVILTNPVDQPLRDGLVVSATLVLDLRQDIITVPREAVLYQGGQGYVYIVENDQAQRRTVGIGPLIDGHFIIHEGLFPGDWVTVVGQHNLMPGLSVVIEKSHPVSKHTQEKGS